MDTLAATYHWLLSSIGLTGLVVAWGIKAAFGYSLLRWWKLRRGCDGQNTKRDLDRHCPGIRMMTRDKHDRN